MWEYFTQRSDQILFASWQHFSLVGQSLLLATLIAVVIAVLSYRSSALTAAANSV